MPRYIKCNYALVLWPHKSKYKCAKCSKVWSQKLIDNKEFRKWNELQKKEISKGTLRAIIKQFELSREEFLRLLN